jgi:hypothetical protein
MTIAQRLGGVLRLDAAVFEEIEADTGATGQAFFVVIGASIAAGIGAGLLLGPMALLRETVGAVVGWVMWAGVTYVLGTRVLPQPQTRTDMGELLRVIGFSYAPNLVSLLALVPFVGRVVRTIVAFWLLAAMVIGVRQALDYTSTFRAFAVVFIGWLIFVAIQWAV